MQKQKDEDEDNKPPSGTDLMAQIYQEKTHKSYEKRARQEKILQLMQDQLVGGETMKRLVQEEKAMNKYIQHKEKLDKADDEYRKKLLKLKESEMKRILDIQLKERDDQKRLKQFECITESKLIT